MVCITCNYEPFCSGCISKHSGKGHQPIALEEKFNYICNFQHECMDTVEKLHSFIDEEKLILYDEIDLCVEKAKEKILEQKMQMLKQIDEIYNSKLEECNNVMSVIDCETLSILPSIEQSIRKKLDLLSTEESAALCSFESVDIQPCARIVNAPDGAARIEPQLSRNKRISFYCQSSKTISEDETIIVKEIFVDRNYNYLLSESKIDGVNVYNVDAYDHSLTEKKTIISKEGELKGFASNGKWNYLIDVEDKSLLRCKVSDMGEEKSFSAFYTVDDARSLVVYNADNLLVVIRRNNVICITEDGEANQVNVESQSADMRKGIVLSVKSEIYITDANFTDSLRVFDPIRKSFLQSYTPSNQLNVDCIGICKQFLLTPNGKAMLSIDLLRRHEITVSNVLEEEIVALSVYGKKVYVLNRLSNGYKLLIFLIRIE